MPQRTRSSGAGCIAGIRRTKCGRPGPPAACGLTVTSNPGLNPFIYYILSYNRWLLTRARIVVIVAQVVDVRNRHFAYL